jgi:peptide-methionine (S)-S-oxide reductase
MLMLAVVAGIEMLQRGSMGVRPALAADFGGSERGVRAGSSTSETVLAGGCYWGMEWLFEHVRGVKAVTSGHAIPVTAEGGRSESAAEAVRIEYDSSVVSYRQLLDIYFSVAHDPTQLNRQGPDVGPNYRSIVFADGHAQRGVVQSYIDSLGAARVYQRPIVTQIAALQSFQAAEPSEQHYAEHHPHSPYIMINDVPKVKALKKRFPALYQEIE